MDNVCHTLVGIAVAKAAPGRTALATATAAIAANLPDIDVAVFATDIPSVAFRRGITHGVPAQLLLPVALAGVMWVIARRRPAARADVRFGWLLALSYIGVLTHVLLDLLNTYGVRLLSPLSQRWFYGDAVFIVDLILWTILGAGVWFARRGHPHAAAMALTSAAVYIGVMVLSARWAREIVHDAWVARGGPPPAALMVGPRPASLIRKQIIVDAGDRYFEGSFTWLPVRVEFSHTPTFKNDDAPGVADARADADVRGFLVWSRFPFWEVRDVAGGTEVRVRDMRFNSGPARANFAATVVVPPR